MTEIFQTILLLLGLLGSHVADPGEPCTSANCPAVPTRPVVALGAPQTLRADEVRLFSRGEHRPGQPRERVLVLHVGDELAPGVLGPPNVLLVAPASERLRPVIAPRAPVEVRLRRMAAAR